MIRRPPRSTLDRSSAASDVYKRQRINKALFHQILRSALSLGKIKWAEKFAKGYIPKLCLLYTSPSPRDRTRSRMPSSA